MEVVIVLSVAAIVVSTILFINSYLAIQTTSAQKHLLIKLVHQEALRRIDAGEFYTIDALWDNLRVIDYDRHYRAVRNGLDAIELYPKEIQDLWHKYHDGTSTRSVD